MQKNPGSHLKMKMKIRINKGEPENREENIQRILIKILINFTLPAEKSAMAIRSHFGRG